MAKPTKDNLLNVYTRIVDIDVFAKTTTQQFLRFVARWAHKRGYWPSADEMAYSKFRKRKGPPISKQEYLKLRRRIRAFALDLVIQGDLEIVDPKKCDLRLTAQGWSKTPYTVIEPADSKEQVEQRKYGFRNRVLTEKRLTKAALVIAERLTQLREEKEA